MCCCLSTVGEQEIELMSVDGADVHSQCKTVSFDSRDVLRLGENFGRFTATSCFGLCGTSQTEYPCVHKGEVKTVIENLWRFKRVWFRVGRRRASKRFRSSRT